MATMEDFELGTWWTLRLDKVHIGTYTNAAQLVAIIDTGTSFTILGITDYLEFATKIYAIGGNGRNFDCSRSFCYGVKTCEHFYDDMPTLSFTFKG